MTQSHQPNSPLSAQAAEGLQLLKRLGGILPILNSLTFTLRSVVWLGVAVVAWIFIWMAFIQGWPLISAIIIAIIGIIPVLFLSRFWWALEQINDLPETLMNLIGTNSQEVVATVQDLRSGTPQKKQLALLSSVRNLWKVGSLARNAKSMAGSYLSFGLLANPLSLFLGVLSLLFILCLLIIGTFLVIISLL